MKLYELAEQYRADVAKLQDLDLPPEVVLDTIDAMQGEVAEKIKAVVIVAMELDEEARVRAEHAKRMADSAKSLAGRAEALRSYAQIAIQNCGLAQPLKYPEFTVALQKNPPSVEVIDVAKLPSPYVQKTVKFAMSANHTEADWQLVEGWLKPFALGAVQIDVTPDKRAIATALKDESTAQQFEGAARFAPTAYRVVVK